MDFSSTWEVLSTSPQTTNGVLVTAEGDNILVITDLSSSKQKKVERVDLVSDNFKYRCEILWFLQNAIHIVNAENKFIDPQAARLIDEICEANCLLF